MTAASIYDLGAGWTLQATGRVVERDFWTGGDTSASLGFFAPTGTPRDELEEARRAQLAALDADSSATIQSRFEVRRGSMARVLHDGVESPRSGIVSVHLPALATRDGVLLRRTLTQDRQGPLGGYVATDITTLGPWLVGVDGTVTELPFQLAVAPLCTLPDGRWLLPGASPLWRDSFAEPLSALGLDGEVDPLVVGGAELRPLAIVDAILPQWIAAEHRDPSRDAFPFFVARAAMDDAIRLRLQFWDADPDVAERDVRWLTVTVGLEDAVAPRLIAHGREDPRRMATLAF